METRCLRLGAFWIRMIGLAMFHNPVAAVAQDHGQFGRVIRIDQDAFLPEAGQISFDEFGLKTANPVYRPEKYGGRPDGVTVYFGGYFIGQVIASNDQCPRGASPTGCLAGNPKTPLMLDKSAVAVFIERDKANPRSPSLSGTPRFNGPVSMIFDREVAGVGLFGGYFNAIKSTAIRVFARDGTLIGGVRNTGTGMEYMALVTEDGSETIAGLQFSLVGPEPKGYAIDDVSFALTTQLNPKQIPSLGDLIEKKWKQNGVVSVTSPKELGRSEAGSLADLLKRSVPSKAPKRKPGSISDLFK